MELVELVLQTTLLDQDWRLLVGKLVTICIYGEDLVQDLALPTVT
jgi:hypothetical protein